MLIWSNTKVGSNKPTSIQMKLQTAVIGASQHRLSKNNIVYKLTDASVGQTVVTSFAGFIPLYAPRCSLPNLSGRYEKLLESMTGDMYRLRSTQ